MVKFKLISQGIRNRPETANILKKKTATLFLCCREDKFVLHSVTRNQAKFQIHSLFDLIQVLTRAFTISVRQQTGNQILDTKLLESYRFPKLGKQLSMFRPSRPFVKE